MYKMTFSKKAAKQIDETCTYLTKDLLNIPKKVESLDLILRLTEHGMGYSFTEEQRDTFEELTSSIKGVPPEQLSHKEKMELLQSTIAQLRENIVENKNILNIFLKARKRTISSHELALLVLKVTAFDMKVETCSQCQVPHVFCIDEVPHHVA